MRTSRQDAAIRAVIPERSNARAALEWALDADDLHGALRITSAIPLMVTSRRRALLERLLDQAGELDDAQRAQVLLTLANLTMEQGHWDDSARFTREAADLFARLDDERHHARARYFEVFALWGEPDQHERAAQLAKQMVNSFRRLNDEFGLAYALWVASQFTGDLTDGLEAASESERLFRRLSAQFGLAHALEGHALVVLKNDTTAGTRPVLAQALTIFADADNLGCTAHCLEAIAAVLATEGDLEPAVVLLGAAEHFREEVGQQHRAWEREGQYRTQKALTRSQHGAELDNARAAGRNLTFSEAVERAHAALDERRSPQKSQTPSADAP